MSSEAELVSLLAESSQISAKLPEKVTQILLAPFQQKKVPTSLSKSVRSTKRNVATSTMDMQSISNNLFPAAMKFLNHLLKSIPKLPPTNSSHVRPVPATASSRVEYMFDAAIVAKEAIITMEKYITLKPLEIEKVMSNVITKLCEAGLYMRALQELNVLRNRLVKIANRGHSECKEKPERRMAKPPTTSGLKRQISSKRKPDKENLPNQSKSKAVSVKKNVFDTDIFHFDLQYASEDVGYTLLVLACQMNAFRCWVEVGSTTQILELGRLISSGNGDVMEWCLHLQKTDAKLSDRQLVNLFRLLHRGAGKVEPKNDEERLKLLELRKCSLSVYSKTADFNPTTLCDIAIKAGLTCDRTIDSPSNAPAILKFYEYVYGILMDTLRSDVALKTKLVDFCEVWAALARKIKDYEAVVNINDNILSLIAENVSTDMSAFFATHNARLSIATARLEICLSRRECPTRDSAVDPALTDSLESVVAFYQLLTSETKFDTDGQIMLLKFFKHGDLFKKSCISLLEILGDDPDNPFNCSYSYFQSIIHEHLLQLCNCVCHVLDKSGIDDETSRKLSRIVIDWLTALAKIVFVPEKVDSHDLAYEYLNQAVTLCRKYLDNEGVRWIANSFYNFGITLYKMKRYDSSQLPLQRSCEILDNHLKSVGCDNDSRYQLSKRFEILGICQSCSHRTKSSQSSFAQAVHALPDSEFSPIGKQSSVLPSLIDRYVKITISRREEHDWQYDSIVTFMEHMEEPIPIMKLVITLENELRCIQENTESKFNSSQIQIALCERLLSLLESTVHPVRRARILLEKAKICRLLRDQDVDCVDVCAEAIEILQGEELHEDTPLQSLRSDCLAFVHTYLGMIQNDQGVDGVPSFARGMKIWKKLLLGVPMIGDGEFDLDEENDIRSRFMDVEATYQHIRASIDYFGLQDLPVLQIAASKLILQLNNGIRGDQCSFSDSVEAFLNITHAYLALGHTGQAGVSLGNAKSILDNFDCNDFVHLSWYITYGYYLSTIGNVEKSAAVFEKAENFDEEVLSNGDDPISKQDRLILMGSVYHAYSFLSLKKGMVTSAIAYAVECLRLLTKWSDRIVRAWTKQHSTNDDGNASATDDPDSSSMYDILPLTSHWNLIKQLILSLERLSHYHLLQGSAKEAEFFCQQGLKLATLSHSKWARSLFETYLGEIEYLRGNFDNGKEYLEKAVQTQGEIQTQKLKAYTQMKFALMHEKQEVFQLARDTFKEADKMLKELMRSDYLLKLESAIIPATPAKGKRSSSRRPSLSSKDKAECCTLLYLEAEISCHTGKIIGREGDLEQAQKIIRQYDEVNLLGPEKSEYHTAASKLNVWNIMKRLTEHPTFSLTLDSVLSLPHRKFLKTTRQGKNQNTTDLLKLIIITEQELLEALDSSLDCSQPQLVYEVTRNLAFLQFLKSYCFKKKDTEDTAWLASYYLDVSNAITSRREWKSSTRTEETANNSKLAWPRENQDDQDEIDGLEAAMTGLSIKETTFTLDESNFHDIEKLSDPIAYERSIANLIPDGWIVCTVSLDIERQDLYLRRITCHGPPIILRLPLQRQALRDGAGCGLTYHNAVNQLNDILSRGNSTAQNGKKYESKEERLNWWKERKELDEQLRQLLIQIESTWLGGFKGLLSYTEVDTKSVQSFKSEIQKLIFKVVNGNRRTKTKLVEFDDEIVTSFLRVAQSLSELDIEDIIYYLLDSYQFNDYPIEFDEIDLDEVVEEFTTIVQKYSPASSNTASVSSTGSHLVLIPDKYLQVIPWESIPVLRPFSVSRLPSISFLRKQLLLLKEGRFTITKTSTQYVLNPSGDLVNTENEFKDFLGSFSNWGGTIGVVPTSQEFLKGLSDKELFIYFGHGGGEQYVKGHHIRKLSKCAVSLLLGCSSGALRPAGEFDPSGTALHYMIGGCPALVANLWDVTDKDSDRFSSNMFRKWGLTPDSSPGEHENEVTVKEFEHSSLCEAVSQSRDSCTLKYLIGAAPVVYGIPVYLI